MSASRKALTLLLALFLLLTAFNFLNFRAAQSNTIVEHQFATYRMGETTPQTMMGHFRMHYRVEGQDRLSRALAEALKMELETKTAVGAATQIAAEAQVAKAPMLYVDLAPQRLWTPFFGRATVTADIFFAYDGKAPWPRDEVVAFEVSPALKADGSFTLTDTSWGILSKPAYEQHLAQALAEDIVTALQNDAFRSPS